MSYRALLRAAPARFFPLAFFARLPYAMLPIATLLATRSATGSLAFAGTAAALQSVSIGVAGLMVGTLADRLGARRVGTVAAAVCALMTIALLVATDSSDGAHAGAARSVILLSSAGAGLTQPGIGLLLRAHWSMSLHRSGRPGLLPTALAWESTADEISFVVGPAMVGLLAAWRPALALGLVAVLLLGAAVPLALLLDQTIDTSRQADLQVKAGRRDDEPRPRLPRFATAALMVGMACIGTVFGSVQVGVTRLATDSGRPADAGLTYALLGFGSCVAGLAYPWFTARLGWRWQYLGSAIALAAGSGILLAGAGHLIPLPAAVTVAGLTVSPYLIALFGAVERIMPARRYTTGLAIVCAGSAVGSAFGQIAGGVLAQRAALLAIALAAVAAVLAVLVAAIFISTTRPGPGKYPAGRPLVQSLDAIRDSEARKSA
jgi:MFS family permease